VEKSTLKPFLRKDLDLLFVGLNPAVGSSRNEHYFSVNQAFWSQLYSAGLITKEIDKNMADTYIFGSNIYNFNKWSYGITDLLFEVAESNSIKIKTDLTHAIRLIDTVKKYNPLVVIFLHGRELSECYL